jgi:23S rRNA pseudouridine2605 synthase
LVRAISKRGLMSRRQAIAAVLAGRVRVDGEVVTDPGHRITPAAVIAVDEQEVAMASRVVFMLHKPRGVVTTRQDPDGRRTVYDLLPPDLPWLVAVGRLDLATSGLLLLTNDTLLADWLSDPRQAIPRTYLVTVRGRLEDETAQRAEQGCTLPGARGPEHLRAHRVRVRKRSGRETHLVVVLTGGRNREIRRLFGALGHEVSRLARVAFGGLELGALPSGSVRQLGENELAAAFPGLPPAPSPGPTLPPGHPAP